MIWFDRDIEIRYAETDQMGIVHHGVYPIYCELSRTHVCHQLGLPYHLLEQEGFFLMVADMYCRYKAPARYGESIYVRGAISKLKRRLIEFQYEVRRREGDKLLFTGSTRHVVTRGTGGPTSLPDHFLKQLSKGMQS